MRSLRTVAGSAAGACGGMAVGLLLGWWIFGRAAATDVDAAAAEPAADRAAASAARPAAGASAGSAAPGLARGRAVATTPAAGQNRSGASDSGAAAQVAQLRAQLRELEAQLESEQALQQEKQGTPATAPAELAARFDPEKVRTALNASLRELGLDGEVNAVDCGEYPCLLVGELKGKHFSREESERLGQSAALAGYQQDSRLSFGTSRREGDRVVNQFGIAIYPKHDDKQAEDNIRKRLHYRFGELCAH
ncbi:MAG: hypothetical protein JXR83_17325 [Deltaproteobacteria bacterium]|nr:hypothetical protein [Deltaproteobacteria bacterium]